jgi:hypothetical protein
MRIDSFGLSALHLYNDDSMERPWLSGFTFVPADAGLEDSFSICHRSTLKLN